MGEIFGHASVVLCWLGPCGPPTSVQDEPEHCNGHIISYSGGSPASSPHVDIECESSQWFQMEGEYGRWWDRVWTLQEFCVANQVKILVGAHVYASETFLWLLESFHRLNTATGSRIAYSSRDRVGLRRSYHKARLDENGKVTSLFDALYLTNISEATDPRDKMYALLGFCPQSVCIQPSYELSMVEVYAQAARVICIEMNCLDSLKDIWPRRQFPNGGLSWIPDFERPSKVYMLLDQRSFVEERNKRAQFAWRPSSPDSRAPKFTIEGNLLMVTGSRLGRINTLYKGFGREQALQRSSIHESNSTWTPSSQEDGPVYQFISKLRFIVQTVTEQLHPSSGGGVPYKQGLPSALKQSFIAHNYTTPLSAKSLPWREPIESRSVKVYVNQAHRTLLGEPFLVMDSGYLRFGDPKMNTAQLELNDEVVLVEGFDWPSVLRPVGGSGKYFYIGRVYIQGVMNREMANGYEQGIINKEEFVFI